MKKWKPLSEEWEFWKHQLIARCVSMSFKWCSRSQGFIHGRRGGASNFARPFWQSKHPNLDGSTMGLSHPTWRLMWILDYIFLSIQDGTSELENLIVKSSSKMPFFWISMRHSGDQPRSKPSKLESLYLGLPQWTQYQTTKCSRFGIQPGFCFYSKGLCVLYHS